MAEPGPPGLTIPLTLGARLSWDYRRTHPDIARLYSEAEQLQWTQRDIDWDSQQPVVPGDRTGFGREAFDASALGRFGEPLWRAFRREQQAWMVSQFLHGEQSALVVSARLAEVLPDMDSKGYAASQAAEEARHAAVFGRYAAEHLSHPYGVFPSFERLVGQILSDSRWDILALGMHVMIESLALGAFRLASATFEDPLIRQITHLTSRDEARHVSFGILLLGDVYGQLSEAEHRYREEFVMEAAALLSRRYLLTDIWERLGVDVALGTEFARSNPMMQAYRCTIFGRVARTLTAVGLMTPCIERQFEQLGLTKQDGRSAGKG